MWSMFQSFRAWAETASSLEWGLTVAAVIVVLALPVFVLKRLLGR